MTLENKNILVIESKEFASLFVKELQKRKAKATNGGDYTPFDLANFLEANQFDGAIIHHYSHDSIREVIEAHRSGRRIVFMCREPIWDTDKILNQALKAARVPLTDRSLGSHGIIKRAVDQLDSLIK